MAHSSEPTVRFTQLVERSGEPHVHTLWLPPEKDRDLRRAEKEHRILTVHTGVAGKADAGVVGFETSRTNATQYLIFPKSLKRFQRARVVGIKFDLVAQPKLASASSLKHAAADSPRRASRRTARAHAPVSLPHAEPATSKPPDRVDETPVTPPSRTSAPKAPPEKSRRSKQTHARAKTAEVRAARKTPHTDIAPGVAREIRAALKELETGKSVAAYHRLQRLV